MASDDDNRSVSEDGETKTGDEDGNHADYDDSSSFNSDQVEELDPFNEDMFEPIHPTSDINPGHVPENGTASGFVEEDGHVGIQQDLQEFGLLNPDLGQETNIMDDVRNYGGIERLLDGLVVQDFPEMGSEADTADGEEIRIAEAIRDSEADQEIPDRAESSAPISSSRRDGENSGLGTGAVAESDNNEAVPTSLLGSGSGIGDNTVASTLASTESEQDDGGNRVSSTPTATSPYHGEAEHSSPAKLLSPFLNTAPVATANP